jgi:predicted SAM-dependent methyltransferase
MVNSEFLTRLSGFYFFHRWYPEVALRYLPIVDEIKKMDKKIKILEVGSGGLGIVPYLKKQVTGADSRFEEPFHPLLKKIKANAMKLPFESNSYDVVLTVDMLEHLEKKDREKAIEEMFRVAKKEVIIAVPCGKMAYEQDVLLDRYYREKRGESFHFLKEQINFGLPDKKSMCDTIEKVAAASSKKISVKTQGNENLKLRMFLMKGWSSGNIIINIIFRKLFLFCIPIFRLFSQEPTYRQLFFISIQNEDSN